MELEQYNELELLMAFRISRFFFQMKKVVCCCNSLSNSYKRNDQISSEGRMVYHDDGNDATANFSKGFNQISLDHVVFLQHPRYTQAETVEMNFSLVRCLAASDTNVASLLVSIVTHRISHTDTCCSQNTCIATHTTIGH